MTLQPPRHMQGFTLVELLVALSLVSLIMLATVSTLRSMAQTEARVDQRLLQSDDRRATVQLLQAALGRVSSRRQQADPTAPPSMLLRARPDSLEWLGVMPARHGTGGLTFFRLAIEDAALVLRMSPWQGQARFPDWRQATARTLLAPASQLQFNYQDDRPLPALWSPDWNITNRLPDRVRIDVATPQRDWPPLVIPLRVLPTSPEGTSLFSVG